MLVVEDATLARVSASDVLDRAGIKVFKAVSADHAIAVLEACPEFQVVVTGIELPGTMNGFEFAEKVRERWPSVGVIVTAGRGHPALSDLLDRLPEGALLLTEPYQPAAIVSLIRQMATPQIVEPPSPLSSGGS